MKALDLINKQFGKLLVISLADNIKPKNKTGRSHRAYNCKCECGNIIVVRSCTLCAGLQKSCGCAIKQSGTAITAGEKFGKLTTISYKNKQWKCKCDCGNETTILTHNLISGNTKSCGCIKSEKSLINIQKAICASRKFIPAISSARKRWQSYCYKDKECNLSFDQWFEICNNNCYYCGSPPQNKINFFKGSSQYSKYNGSIVLNGLDRIDNNKPHILDNVCSCCSICNRAKLDRSINDFYNYIKNFNKRELIIPEKLKLPEKYLLTSIKMVYRNNYINNYKSIDFDLETFYTYSQQPCYYCGAEKTNYYNVYLTDKKASSKAKENAGFYYNGIDRIDSLKNHTIDNIVPCCKYCNFAKSNLTIDEFNNWINRIKEKAQQLIVAL